MRVMLTGASGTLGKEILRVLLDQGYQVLALCHRNPLDVIHPNLTQVKVDLGKDNPFRELKDLGPIDEVIHSAATVALGKDSTECFRLNSGGTFQMLYFMATSQITSLKHVSTAYLKKRNPYEQSKEDAEGFVEAFSKGYGGTLPPIRSRIFRPGILLQGEGKPSGAFYQFVSLVARVHKRAELVRRKVEGALRLPVVKPVLRVKGDPEAFLNLILAQDVAKGIVLPPKEAKEKGVLYLTNPNPVKLKDLGEWMGEALLMELEFHKSFKMTPVEALFHKMASPFLPYLWGDEIGSDLPQCTPITKEFVLQSVVRTLL